MIALHYTAGLLVFRSRRDDRLKILTCDQDGFVLWYKRLELGVLKLPRVEAGGEGVRLPISVCASKASSDSGSQGSDYFPNKSPFCRGSRHSVYLFPENSAGLPQTSR